jgi:protein-S-isoprenylcysteine O-methyltransferase Ste14
MSRDRRHLFRHLGAILALPLNVLIVIPAAILLWTQGADPGWGLESPFRFGEAALFGSCGIFVWFACYSVCNMLYLPLMGEPALERRFGEPYRRYRANVPRGIPRRSVWQSS